MRTSAEYSVVPMLNAGRYPPARKAVFIAADGYRRHHYGKNHPLGIPRVSLTLDLIRAYGALGESEYADGRLASIEELQRFHTAAYVRALQDSEAAGSVAPPARERHHLGTLENPWFPGLFQIPALATGSSIQGAEMLLQGVNAFSPAGGMHHARPDRAQGFCYLNDVVLAILRLRQEGLRVLYIDIDAHHGDGVEAAFFNDPKVFTLSLHMDTRYAYPFHGGAVTDQGGPAGECACLNVPLPGQVNDTEYALVFDTLWPQVVRQFQPDSVVFQAGTDALFADPLGRFRVSTQAFLGIVERIVGDSPRLLVVGGGGYHPLLVARCWTGVWALLSGRTLPEAVPPAGQALLGDVAWDTDEDAGYAVSLTEKRIDAPQEGAVRDAIWRLLDEISNRHPRMTAIG